MFFFIAPCASSAFFPIACRLGCSDDGVLLTRSNREDVDGLVLENDDKRLVAIDDDPRLPAPAVPPPPRRGGGLLS